ncbi:MAG: hypothetical protein QOI63_344 [Thermoplasmata archaeon]|jgi:hypothetical protein|nr:hypothetical protein [Thermoplasmata archaeon]
MADSSGLSLVAREALGCLAAFDHTGPHSPDALRRHTRLTPAAFEAGLHELVTQGLAHLEGNGMLWLTHKGERITHRLFSFDAEAAGAAQP